MGKGEQTRQLILDEAISVASRIGLESLSIGLLADRTKLSKSGLFAHFGSKEEMQLAVIEEAERRFTQIVVLPALSQARGLTRLRAMFGNWLNWTNSLDLPGGCLLMAASIEFDDRPGAVRDAVSAGQRRWRDTLAGAIRLAVASGELAGDADAEQIAFEIVGMALATQQATRLLGEHDAQARAMAAFERLVRHHAPQR